MANLKDLIVNGVSRFIGKVYINDSHITTINGVAVTETPKFTDTTALGSMTGTLGVDHGGTGKTTGKDAANYFMNSLDTGSSTPGDADYYISQYVNGGTTTTTYHRRPMSALWTYIKGKIDAAGYANQNAFSNIKIGNSTVSANAKTDTVQLAAGENIILTSDINNKKITIDVQDMTPPLATQATSGLMSASDKIVINQLESKYVTKTQLSNHVVVSKTQPTNQQTGDVWVVVKDL